MEAGGPLNRAVIKIKRTLQRALAKAEIDGDASAIASLARELLKVEDRIAAEAAAAATATAGGASDNYLRWLTTPELQQFLSLYQEAQSRKARGDAPSGGAVRRIITDTPIVEDRIHVIERIIVHPPTA